MAAPVDDFPYNAPSPIELSAGSSSMRGVNGEYAQPYFTSHHQQQYLNSPIDDSRSLRTYEMSDTDGVSQRMHLDLHSSPMSSQFVGTFDGQQQEQQQQSQQNRQVVLANFFDKYPS